MARRLILGQRNTGEYGLWLSKPGKDVFSTNVSDFMISDVAGLQPFTSGTVNSIAMSSSAAYANGIQAFYQLNIPHNLGYIPSIIAASRWLLDGNLGSWVDTVNFYLSFSHAYPSVDGSPPNPLDLTNGTSSGIDSHEDGTVNYAIFAVKIAAS